MIGAVIAGTQAAVGIGQAVAGYSKLKNLTRPEYQIPSEIEQNMSEAELMSYYGMPDAQKQSYMQNIQRSGQQALSGTADRKGGLGMVSAIQQNQQDSYSDLLSADVQQRMQNIQTAQNMRNVMAGYKDKAFQMNEMQPYQQDYAEAQGLIGAGMQNFMGGLQSGGQMLMLNKQMKALDAVNNVAKNVNTGVDAVNTGVDAVNTVNNSEYKSMILAPDSNLGESTGPNQYQSAADETFTNSYNPETIPYGGYKSKMDFTSYDNRVVPQIFPQGNMQTAPIGPQPVDEIDYSVGQKSYTNPTTGTTSQQYYAQQGAATAPPPVDMSYMDNSTSFNFQEQASPNPFINPSSGPGGLTGLLYPELMPGTPYGGYNPQPLNFGLPTGQQINNLLPLNNY
tara:strand:- start:2158 stop:3342 length:1185 start_codon:yes stop_codon:yes gene_type:complete